MCIHKSATALLLDGEPVVARGYEYPSLGVVVFRSAGNECEVISRTLIRVHESAIALLLNGVHPSNRCYSQPLWVLVLCGVIIDGAGVHLNFMCIHIMAIAILLDAQL